ncbi:hypothetical protein I6F19_26270 [Ensifer sp. BRP08]|nr:hypothetical protein [Ensifer sp. BRP08]
MIATGVAYTDWRRRHEDPEGFCSVALGRLCGPWLGKAQDNATALVQEYLASGDLGQADEQLLALTRANASNADAQLGLGLVRSVRAFQNLSQSLYRAGFAPNAADFQSLFGLRAPIPVNPSPEPITYDEFRAILMTYIADLEAADRALEGFGEHPSKLSLDLAIARFARYR